ncbi:MAG TPA: terminase [Verrucomicrobiae bacterium]|jgi:hypothetical protein|nr:terminase [Verrucomicrobiae bacterium]
MASTTKSKKLEVVSKRKHEIKAALNAAQVELVAAEEAGKGEIFSAEWLTWVGQHLDEKPPAHRRIGPYRSSPEAGSWREYLMWALLKIRGKSGHLRKLELNRAQRDLERTSAKRNVVLKARQLGITTYVAARFFLSSITREGTLSVQVAHDQRSAEEIFRIVHRLLENLPAELRKGALMTSRANVRQLVFPVFDSEYRVETAADPNAGRGLTIHNLHCSEVARWPRDVSETLASLRAAVPPDGEIFLESTPNGAGGAFYDEWQRAPQTGYARHFYPWWWDRSYRLPVEIVQFTDEEVELMQKHRLDAAQIAFRREVQANFRNHAREEFAEDPESCFLASGDCIFDADIIEKRLKQSMPAMEESDEGQLLTFLPPILAQNGAPPKQYIIGVDPAGGGSEGDYSCAQVIEVSGGMQCAELRGHLPPQELAAKVAVLAQRYNGALVAVERNNHGYGVLAHLSLSEGCLNLYKMSGQPGWLTNVVTRPRMLEQLRLLLANGTCIFFSPRFLEECRTFIRHPDGSCAAAPGGHDDTVMAMAIAQAVRAELRIAPAKSPEEAQYRLQQAA